MRIVFLFLSIIVAMTIAPMSFADAADVAATSASLPDGLAPQLDELGRAVGAIHNAKISDNTGQSENEIDALLDETVRVENESAAILAQLQPYQALYRQLLDIVGPPPASGTPPEAANIPLQRQHLTLALQSVESEIRQAKLYGLEAHEQNLMIHRHVALMQKTETFKRFASPLTAKFWSSLSQERGGDQNRLTTFHATIVQFAQISFSPRRGWILISGLTMALMLALVGPKISRELLLRSATHLLPQTRVRRSGVCFGATIVGILIAALSYQAFKFALTFKISSLSADMTAFLSALSAQVELCGYIIGLGYGLLSIRGGSWRLLHISDVTARSLRVLPIWFAGAVMVLGLLRYLNMTIGLGVYSQQVVNGAFVLAVSPLLVIIPRRLKLPHRSKDVEHTVASVIGSMVIFLASSTALICWVSVLVGYIPLAYLIISWLTLMAITCAGLYLISCCVEDILESFLASGSRLTQQLSLIGIRPEVLEQTAVLISGLVKAFLVVVALAVAETMGDFDASSVAVQLNALFHGQKIGNVTVSINTLIAAAIVLFIGANVIKLLRHWLQGRYFPKTRLDVGAQTSVITIFSYAAWILVFLATLSTAGVTVQKLAWVVSALSVGIGFGLQAIVQNFVSGLIVLAERPVKVGDLVQLGGATGDIKRISVRATELVLGDGSTLIVPNSQIITSAVTNMTSGNRPGSVSITLPFPLGVDVVAALDILLHVYLDEPMILDDPAPTVAVSTIEKGIIVLKGTGFTQSARAVDAAKGAVLLTVYQRLMEAGIPIAPQK